MYTVISRVTSRDSDMQARVRLPPRSVGNTAVRRHAHTTCSRRNDRSPRRSFKASYEFSFNTKKTTPTRKRVRSPMCSFIGNPQAFILPRTARQRASILSQQLSLNSVSKSEEASTGSRGHPGAFVHLTYVVKRVCAVRRWC